MTIHWSLSRVSTAPAGDDWLGPDERAVQQRFKIPKRRSDWRLGRFTAKRLLADVLPEQSLERIQIIAAEDGAPDVFVDGERLAMSISISHRTGVAACALAFGARVGCDLEAVEPRTSRFVADYFTDTEARAVRRSPGPLRDRHVALIWSGKESALKLLRTGLRRDTRSVQIDVAEPAAGGADWSRLQAEVLPERLRFEGWWLQDDDVVLTLVCEDPSLRVARHHE